MTHRTNTTESAPADAAVAPKPAKPANAKRRRTQADKNLTLVGKVWYFRRLEAGVREYFSLETSDRAVARDRRDAHLAAHRGKTVAQIREAKARANLAPVESARLAFLGDRERHGVRDATLRGYTQFTDLFARAFPGTRWQSLTPEEFDAWLRGRYASPVSAATAARHIGAMLNWADKPPVRALDNPELAAFRFKKPLSDTAVEFLTVEESGALLAAAGSEALPPIALGLFAGIRPEEVARMDWSMIDWDERRIRIPAQASKTRAARNIEGVPDALWRHLAPWRGKSDGPIHPSPRKPIESARRAAKLTRWPHDALRHTFATYYCALVGNPGIVAHALGHSNLGMLTRHYNGVAKKSAAEKFFAL